MSSKPLVAVLGASPKPERYSNKAVKMLLENGYKVAPVHPQAQQIEGLDVYKSLSDITEKIHTVTIYVSGDALKALSDEIVKVAPERVIFNPGTEDEQIEKLCAQNNIKTVDSCTLVMLRTSQF